MISSQVHKFISQVAGKDPARIAALQGDRELTYGEMYENLQFIATEYLQHGLTAGDRVAVYLPKGFVQISALFAASLAGGVFVPINPQLKAAQVKHIVEDSDASILVTSAQRYSQLKNHLPSNLSIIIEDDLIGRKNGSEQSGPTDFNRRINKDLAALLYTSGSTGKPKGVMLSHLNLTAGAASVVEYLELTEQDRLLALLPLSFDYGLNQVISAFAVGASVVLADFLLPNDIPKLISRFQVTGLAAVPPIWIQLAQLSWPDVNSLRFITNSGGAMPHTTLEKLRACLPQTQIYLMYGLTEAFRSSYLDPSLVQKHPDSIGKAIPNAELLVINENGELAKPHEHGQLVHRGVHVAMGYWNDIEKTKQRFRSLPKSLAGADPLEKVVWSGDTVTYDEDGLLYFVTRADEMIKTSGYRVSPDEIEEIVYQVSGIHEAVAIGAEHPTKQAAIVVLYTVLPESNISSHEITQHCRKALPTFMQPDAFIEQTQLPKNPNGKFDRAELKQAFKYCLMETKND